MALVEKQDYVYYADGFVMTSKAPMKQFQVCIVGTKNYIFFIPRKSMGFFVILNTIKTHSLFSDVPVEEGVERLIGQCDTVEALETAFCNLLEDDPKYVHKLSDQTSFKFRGFLGKHTLRMATSKMNWTSGGPKKGKLSKEFRAYYGQ